MSDPVSGPWAELVTLGTRKAMSGLSQMIGTEIEMVELDLRRVPVTDISQAFGGPDRDAVGIYLTVSGSADGHMMLMYEPQIALAFVDLLMGQPAYTTASMTEMGRSALGEMGNVISALFLNAISDATGLQLHPSPPEVMTDMAGALLDVISSDIVTMQDDAYIAETTFTAQGSDVTGVFMVLPTEALLQTLLSTSRAA